MIEQLLDQADEFNRIKSNNHSNLYYNESGGGGGGDGNWRLVVGPPRRMETITFGLEAQELRRDVESFLSPGARELFRKRLLPYQRCYMLYGPPGNGKSSILQALSIKFNLKLFFLKVTKTTTKAELLGYLSKPGTSKNCMICIEDAESAFESDEVLEREEAQRKASQTAAKASAGPSSFGGGAGDGDDFGGGGSGGGMFSGNGGGGFGGGFGMPPYPNSSAQQSVTAKVFVDMIRGDGAAPPDKRLVFFSTNHISKMPLELKELVDQQGSRTCFPNADRDMMGCMFEMFFSEPENLKLVQACRATFVKHVGEASWFTGWATSNVSGASLSEFFQRHRNNPERACECISGVGTEFLQTIVEDGPEYISPDMAGNEVASDDEDGDSDGDGDGDDGSGSDSSNGNAGGAGKGGKQGSTEDSGFSSSAAFSDTEGTIDDALFRPLYFGVDLSGAPWRIFFCLVGYLIAMRVETWIQQHPAGMSTLAVAAGSVRLLPVGTWKKVVGCFLLFALCTVDCDGDGNVWVLDAQDDTTLCMDQFFDGMQQHTYYLEYAQPRISAMLAEAWTTMPMAICMLIFIGLWLLADVVALYISSFLWVRFEVKGTSELNSFVYIAMQRQRIEQAARLEAGTPNDVPEHQHTRKLWAINHDAESIAADRYRELVADLPPSDWVQMSHALSIDGGGSTSTSTSTGGGSDGAGGSGSGSAVPIWTKGLMSKKEMKGRAEHRESLVRQGYTSAHGVFDNDAVTSYRIWRWGPHWVSVNGAGARDILFDFLQKHYVNAKTEELRATPTVAMCEYPFASSSLANHSGGGRGRGRGRSSGSQRITAPGQAANVPIGGLSSFVWPDNGGPGGLSRRGGWSGRGGSSRGGRGGYGRGRAAGTSSPNPDESKGRFEDADGNPNATDTLQHLLDLFEDAVRFQSIVNKRWYVRQYR